MASYSNMDDCTVIRRIEILKDWVMEATSCCVFYDWGLHYGLLIIVIVLKYIPSY